MNFNLMFQPLRKYADFQGRAARSEFWLWALFLIVVDILMQILLVPFGGMMHYDLYRGMVMPAGLGMGVFGLFGLFFLAIFIPNLAVAVRRLHDIDKSGWWLLLGFIPLIGGIVLLIFYCIDGTPGSNRFGPNPKDAAAPEAFS